MPSIGDRNRYYTDPFDDLEIYPFYSTPDGEQCLEKTIVATKYSSIFGAVCSVYQIILITKPKTIRAGLGKFLHLMGPYAGMGFVFGSSLCILGQLRKKNDVTNHVIAGALAGSVWGFKYNRVYPGKIGALYCGFLAGYIKFFKVNNYTMFEKKSENERRINYPDMNFTVKLYDDPGRPDRA